MINLGTKKLETERLLLRKFEILDAKEVCSGYRNQLEFLYYAGKQKIGHFEQEKIFTEFQEKYEKLDFYNWAIVLKESNKIIGSVNLKIVDSDTVRVNYAIDNRYTGNGYMSEALRCVMDYAILKVKVKRFEGGCAIKNIASKRVLEKCGLKFEKIISDYFGFVDGKQDMLLYVFESNDHL